LSEIFIDTSYIISLTVLSDSHHQKALALSKKIREEKLSVVTTKAILLELGNAFSTKKYRSQGVDLISALEKDSSITVVSLDQNLFDQAFKLFKKYKDKEWGLVDCVSFIVMKSRGIEQAFTADKHFKQAGFRALLLEN